MVKSRKVLKSHSVNEVVEIKCTAAEKRRIKLGAEMLNLPVCEYGRRVLAKLPLPRWKWMLMRRVAFRASYLSHYFGRLVRAIESHPIDKRISSVEMARLLERIASRLDRLQRTLDDFLEPRS
jgi:hypothetical protein